MVAILYVMGVSSIKEFAAPLMVGIICGAYLLVCITGALWLYHENVIQKNSRNSCSKAAGSSAKSE